MYRLLIADDEPKIRNRIAQMLDWAAIGIEVAALAENGQVALDLVKQQRIDLCIVDIRMPLLNGLDFIEQVHSLQPDMLCIIVSGHDEFSYAQRSVQLHVFDYLLKPLKSDVLQKCIERVLEAMRTRDQLSKQRDYALELVRNRLPVLREDFLGNLIRGVLSNEEIHMQQVLLDLTNAPFEVAFLMLDDSVLDAPCSDERSEQMLGAMTRNTVSELMGKDAMIVFDDYDNLISLRPLPNDPEATALEHLESMLAERLQRTPRSCYTAEINSLQALPGIYSQWCDTCQSRLSPLTQQALAYIDTHYANSKFNLNTLTSMFHVSTGHLSRLFRKEIGMTFIEYLIRVRIRYAVKLLDSTDMRIYEIADRVGYSSQHYFCSAFKRVLGVAPTEYRSKGGSEHESFGY